MNMVEHAPIAAQPKMLKHSLKKKPSPQQQHMGSASGNSKWPAARQQQQLQKPSTQPPSSSKEGGGGDGIQQLKGRRPSSVVTSIDWRKHEEMRQKKEQEERQLQKQREQERFRKQEQKRMQQKQQVQQKQNMQVHMQQHNHNNMRGLAPSPAMSASHSSTSGGDDPAKPRIRRPSSVVTSLDWRAKQNGDEPSHRSSFSTVNSNNASSTTFRTASPIKMVGGNGNGSGESRRTSKTSVRSATPSQSNTEEDDDERPLTSADAVKLVLRRLRENGKAHLGEDAPLTPPPSPKKSQASKKQPVRNTTSQSQPPKAQQRTQDDEKRQPPSPPAPVRQVQNHHQQQRPKQTPAPSKNFQRSTSDGADDELDNSSMGSSSYEGQVVNRNKERALSSDEAVQLVMSRMRSNASTDDDDDDDDDDDESEEDNELVDSGHARPQPQYPPGGGKKNFQAPAGSSNVFWKTLQEAKERQDAIRERVRRYSSEDEEEAWVGHNDNGAKAKQFGSNSSAFSNTGSSHHRQIEPSSRLLRDSHANKVPYDRHHQLDCDPSLMFAEDIHMSDSRAWERLNQLSTSASGSSSGSGYFKQPQLSPASQFQRNAAPQLYSYQPLSREAQFSASNVTTIHAPEKMPSMASTSSSSSKPRSFHQKLDEMPSGGNDSTRSIETAFFDAEEDDDVEQSLAPRPTQIPKATIPATKKTVISATKKPSPPVKKALTLQAQDESDEESDEESEEDEEEEEEYNDVVVVDEKKEGDKASSGWGFSSLLGATVSSGTSILGQALSTSVSMASSTAASATSIISTTIASRSSYDDNDVSEGDDGENDDEDGYANRRKPKHPPKNTKIASRELEIIRKCQEQVKLREIEEAEKLANAAKLDEENMRLQREEEAARAIVTREVQAYRAMMIDMGEGDKLAPEDAEKAQQEYDDRLAMADTLQEQEAKAKAAQEQMAKVDQQAKEEEQNEEGSEGEYSYEAEGCCCVVM